MEDRRTFIKTLAVTLAASRSVLGANDRVQMGVIGTGMRGNQVYQSFMRNKDVVFVTACDVRKSRLDKFVADSGTKMTAVGDYRRVLDNKDVDGVLLTVPDHWHSPMVIQALQAGKDIYCEKPISNTLEAAIKMRDACRASKQIVQVGCQQRSWQHFQDQAKRIKEGYIGKINHCVLLFVGYGAFGPAQQEKPEAPPPDLDWEMFQGPAPRHPYVPSRLNWRAYWDYGGGSITDWGVHLTDVMLWYMNSDSKGPLLTSASYMYTSGSEDPEKAPDTFSVTWKYDGFVGTFNNATPPGSPGLMMSDMYGNWFYGQKAVVLVNRYGFEVKPLTPMTMGQRAGAGTPAQAPPPLPAERDMDPNGISEDPDSKFGSATVRHTRNFLDCVKSRNSGNLACPMDVGFNSTLPTLLAVMSVRQNKMFTWDGRAGRPA
jgi:predicted dehydrogenase